MDKNTITQELTQLALTKNFTDNSRQALIETVEFIEKAVYIDPTNMEDNVAILNGNIIPKLFEEYERQILHKNKPLPYSEDIEEPRLLRDGEFEVKKTVDFIYKDSKRHILYGIVYEPDEEDTQGDYTTAEDIEKAYYDFMLNYQNFNIEHSGELAHQVKIVACDLAHTSFQLGDGWVKKGTWYTGVWLPNDIWKGVESGDITGFSMEGTAVRE